MSLIIVDIEADGPAPGKDLFSMVCFGAVLLDKDLTTTFYGQTKPISTKFDPENLAISGFTREQHLDFPDPQETMLAFEDWIARVNKHGRAIFVADNPGWDFGWINHYFWTYLNRNPFGHSSRRIGDLFCGLEKNMHYGWKRFRKTKHTHNPVDDSLGNAECLLELARRGVKGLL